MKVSVLAGGGMMLSFNSMLLGKTLTNEVLMLPAEPVQLNSYIKIASDGAITLMSANPEFGSNVKTSMPMILADELDVDWSKVTVEQADFYPERFQRQFTGGSQGIRQGWKPLRTAGATARRMLVNAAAKLWNVPEEEITTASGALYHVTSGKKASYGEMASAAAALPVPKDVPLKKLSALNIIGTSKKNVDGKSIVTGKPLFGIDHKQDGMLIAMITHAPAIGLSIKSVDDKVAKSMPGIKDVFTINTLKDDYERNAFDTTTFTELVVVVGNTTWEVMNAKKALKIEWQESPEKKIAVKGWAARRKQLPFLQVWKAPMRTKQRC